VRSLQQAFGPQAVFTTDIGNHLVFAAEELEVRQADGFHAAIGVGGMGSGIGTAIGLALAHRGSRPVVGICGDGSFLMHGSEIATCAKYGIPLVLAVFNDGQLGMVEHGNHRVFHRSTGCETPDVRVRLAATAYGADAMYIHSEDDLVAAASRTLTGPLVLEIPIDPNVQAANPRASTFAQDIDP